MAIKPLTDDQADDRLTYVANGWRWDVETDLSWVDDDQGIGHQRVGPRGVEGLRKIARTARQLALHFEQLNDGLEAQYQYGVRFDSDGSVAAHRSGRTQRKQATQELEQLRRDYTHDSFTLVRRLLDAEHFSKDSDWEPVPEC